MRAIYYTLVWTIWMLGAITSASAEPGDVCWSKFMSAPLEAIPDCTLLINKDEWTNNGFKSTIYFKRGVARLMDALQRKTKKFDGAFDDLTESIEIEPSPNRGTAYYFRANIHMLRGNKSSAVRDFKKSLELEPNGAFHPDAEKQIKKLGG